MTDTTHSNWLEIAENLRQIADSIERLDLHDTPAWQANERLNARVEVCYQALENIVAMLPASHPARAIARDALEAAANV